jgi:lysyl-tRNA synthetase class 2
MTSPHPSPKIIISCLRRVYELRKTISTAERMAQGRVFFYHDKPGVCDSSGAIWPVEAATPALSQDWKEGDIIFFTYDYSYTGEEHLKKYDDHSFSLKVLHVTFHIVSQSEWKNPLLPSPIPINFQKPADPSLLAPLCTATSTTYTAGSRFYTNPEFERKKNFVALRKKALRRTQEYFENRGFQNIETPTLVPSGGVETYLNPFSTTYTDHRGNTWPLELPTSPEFALKKILSTGVEKIYQLSRAYRNQGEVSRWHEPEFVMLEWYRRQGKLAPILADIEGLTHAIATCVASKKDVPKQWPRFAVNDLFLNILGFSLINVQNRDDFYALAKTKSTSISATDTWDDLFCKLFMEFIEPHLAQYPACFVTHYPIQMAALAAPAEDGPFAQRTEAFLYGVEVANAYLELIDSAQLQARFDRTQQLKPSLKRDAQFENAMAFGLPPCAGVAVGIDRIIAVLCECSSLSDLYDIPFLSQFPKGTVAWE